MKDQKQNRARALGVLGRIPFNGMLGIEISRLHDDGVTLEPDHVGRGEHCLARRGQRPLELGDAVDLEGIDAR